MNDVNRDRNFSWRLRFISLHVTNFVCYAPLSLTKYPHFLSRQRGKAFHYSEYFGYNGGPRTAHAQRVIHCRQDRLFAIYREAVILNCRLCQTQCEYKRTTHLDYFLPFINYILPFPVCFRSSLNIFCLMIYYILHTGLDFNTKRISL